MAIIDINNEFAAALSIAGPAGTTALIGNSLDTYMGGFDVELDLVISAFTGIQTAGGAGTLTFQLASDNSASISTTGSAQVLFQTPSFATSGTPIPAGTVLFVCRLPHSLGIIGGGARRFLGVLAIIGGAAITAGSISARLVEPDAAHGWQATAQAAN